MKAQEVLEYLRKMKRDTPPPDNPWATESAAETLAQQGHTRDAAAICEQIGPSAQGVAMDPMEFWILVEEGAD